MRKSVLLFFWLACHGLTRLLVNGLPAGVAGAQVCGPLSPQVGSGFSSRCAPCPPRWTLCDHLVVNGNMFDSEGEPDTAGSEDDEYDGYDGAEHEDAPSSEPEEKAPA